MEYQGFSPSRFMTKVKSFIIQQVKIELTSLMGLAFTLLIDINNDSNEPTLYQEAPVYNKTNTIWIKNGYKYFNQEGQRKKTICELL